MLLNINKMDLFHAFAKLELPFMLFKDYRLILGEFDDRPMFEDYVFDTTDAESIYQLIIDRILADPKEHRIVLPNISHVVNDRRLKDMFEAFYIQRTQLPREIPFCAAVCAVSHRMAGTSFDGLIERVEPLLVDKEQRYRLRAVDAAMSDIEVLKIYDDHVRNVDNLVPDKHRCSHYLLCVREKLFGVHYD